MRSSGILLPISSLPGLYGVGTLGSEAYQFVDFLESASQSYWQILPLGPITIGDSPYQTFSSFAGGEIYLDLESLYAQKLITKKELMAEIRDVKNVDYDDLKKSRMALYKNASVKFFKNLPSDFDLFKEEEWVIPYARYRALKTYYNDSSFNFWDKDVIEGNLNDEILSKIDEDYKLHLFIQYQFFKAWYKLKAYANQKHIQIIGDLPIYVSYDSADVCQNKEYFDLDENYEPNNVAGCPPDGFSPLGQVWGNPLYNYQKMKENNYEWWVKRILHSLKMYDWLRLDHFRGMEAYFSIPKNEKTAQNGKWIKGPGFDIFEQVFKIKKDAKMIMEDLGFLTKEVHLLLKKTKFPGMKILEFAFDGNKDNMYLPHNFIENTVVYTGTHDNNPINGWIKEIDERTKMQIYDYFNIQKEEEINEAMIKGALSSIAFMCIIPIQDYLGLDETSRINIPSTSSGNWAYRIKKEDLNVENAEKIKNLTKKYYRLNPFTL